MGHGGFILDKSIPGFPYIPLIDGVELFFVLSGFLIGTILLKIYKKNDGIDFKEVFSFWKRRWFRTIPNYYLVLILNILFVSTGIIGGKIENFNWKFFVFLQNFNTYFTDFFWESWSLTIEEWFYIFTPIAIVVFHKSLVKVTSKKNIILLVIGTFVLLPLLYRYSISDEQVDPFWFDVKFRKVVLARLDAIMFGVFFAWIKYYYPLLWKKIAIPFFIIGLILIFSLLHFIKLDPIGFYAKTIYFSLIGFSAAMLLPYADSVKTFRTAFGKVITHISLISYSMYLINLALVAQVILVHFLPQTEMESYIMYVIYWVTVIVASTFLYKYFEKPITDLREFSTSKTGIS
ncbi:MAG: acyltransferase [Bacteroidetes bacterium]|nr:acyltransferase [Bacteroidota bacterium]